MAKSKADTQAISPTSTYTVVARRYRPQQLSDLVGQEHITSALRNALTIGRVAHAYLFTGARGTGKTSTARILAKALNCVQGPTADPCDRCEMCTSIAAGQHIDVLEIDAASHTGVDSIRELRQNVGFLPQQARYKIYIIDEVHMLSNSAFNALLKTLEEPPAHVKFLLATTEVRKIPITILSRCQRFDFGLVRSAQIVESIRSIVKQENIAADDDALQLIARRAAGSMRDAQTLLDQVFGIAGERLSVDAVNMLLGYAGDDRVCDLAEAVLNRNASSALKILDQVVEQGLSLGELTDRLIDFWRGLMLVVMVGAEARDLPGGPAMHERIQESAKHCTLDHVLGGIDLLTTARAKMRESLHAQVILEVALVRLCRLDELMSIPQLAQALSSTESAVSNATVRSSARPPALSSTPGNPTAPVKKNALTERGSHDPVKPAEFTALTNATLKDILQRVAADLGPIRGNHLRAAQDCAIVGPNSLVLRYASNYTAAYEAIHSETNRDAIGLSLKRITGAEWQIRVEYDRSDAPPVESPSRATVKLRKQELMTLPLFAKINQTFGTEATSWLIPEDYQPRSQPTDEAS